jgi:PucR family transcriptional regulator, purine catabolism regulatory protein
VYPTLSEVLEIPTIAAGRPLVRAGRSALDTQVRWVHVVEQTNPAGTLAGGELVLSIGVAISDPATDLAAYLTNLRAAGAIGLMIELGQRLQSLPENLIQHARAINFPVIELRRAVRFIEVTEAVHARILTEQYARLQFTEKVAHTFRSLAVEGVTSARVVTEAALLLGLPVVLEDLGHRVLAVAGGDADKVLRHWVQRSRQVPRGSGAGWVVTPVGRRDQRWGRLVIPVRASGDDRVPMVLQHSSDALTLLGLADSRNTTPMQDAQNQLLADLVHSPHSPEPSLLARAAALGFRTTAPFIVLVLRPTNEELHNCVATTAASAAQVSRRFALVGELPGGAIGVVIPSGPGDDEDGIVSAVMASLTSDSVPACGVAGCETIDALPEAISEALQVAEIVGASSGTSVRRAWRSQDLGIHTLLWSLRDDPRFLAYVEEQLSPILNEKRDGVRRQLQDSVRAFTRADGNIAAYASSMGTSRQTAYARMAKLSQVLGRDLADPLTKVALQVAVLGLDLTDSDR